MSQLDEALASYLQLKVHVFCTLSISRIQFYSFFTFSFFVQLFPFPDIYLTVSHSVKKLKSYNELH